MTEEDHILKQRNGTDRGIRILPFLAITLLAGRHLESVDFLLDTQSTRVQRGMYGAVTREF